MPMTCELSADSVIDSVRGGYRFAPNRACLDVARWEEGAAEGRSAREAGDLDAAVSVWSTALGLFRGEPLAGIPGPCAEGERLRLAEHRLLVVRDKADCQLRLGRHAEVVAELFSLTATHPHNEALAALLMRALHAGDRQADALDVYAATRRRLVDAQGVEPGAELRRVHEAVLRGDASGPRQPGLATRPKRARHELPVEIGDFTGRDRELDLLALPGAAHAVTVRVVDGMAGVGKTALAVRAARTLRDAYPDGCLFVELHGNRESRERREATGPHRVLRRLLRAVGAAEGEDSEDLDELAASWRAATASLRLLLVLDDAARAEQVRPLLPAGPGSMVLVTSRRRLTGLDADRRLSLTPLGMDDAAGLLARIVGGTAGREDAAVRRLAALCDRLPLALRIAGARIQDRPPWAVEALVAQLADDERRLDALAAEDRSVEVAFQVSYDQLPAAEQRAFRALGLSPTVRLDRLTLAALLGGTPLDAGRVLESLADASLVQRVAAERYRLHDLVAVYARRIATSSPGTSSPATRSSATSSPAKATAARSGVFQLYVAAAHSASDWGNPALRTGPQGTRPFADWEEATNWLDAAGGELVDVIGQAAAAGHLDDACRIAEGLVDYLTRQGRFHECRTALELLVPLVDRAGDLRTAAALRRVIPVDGEVALHVREVGLADEVAVDAVPGDRDAVELSGPGARRGGYPGYAEALGDVRHDTGAGLHRVGVEHAVDLVEGDAGAAAGDRLQHLVRDLGALGVAGDGDARAGVGVVGVLRGLQRRLVAGLFAGVVARRGDGVGVELERIDAQERTVEADERTGGGRVADLDRLGPGREGVVHAVVRVRGGGARGGGVRGAGAADLDVDVPRAVRLRTRGERDGGADRQRRRHHRGANNARRPARLRHCRISSRSRGRAWQRTQLTLGAVVRIPMKC